MKFQCYAEEHRKAYYTHICGHCQRTIEKREKYRHVQYRLGKKFIVEKTCNDCLSAEHQFFPGEVHSDIWTDIESEVRDFGGQVPGSSLAKMTSVARVSVEILMKRYGEDI